MRVENPSRERDQWAELQRVLRISARHWLRRVIMGLFNLIETANLVGAGDPHMQAQVRVYALRIQGVNGR